MSWHYAEGTTQRGPVSDDEFAALVQAGTVKADTLVWREGMANWQPWRTVAAAQTPSAALAGDQAACAECGRVFPRKDMAAYTDLFVCEGCKDAFFQKVREGVATAGGFVYAGFWIRFVAKFIDGLLLWVVNFLVQLPVTIFMGTMMTPSGGPEAGAAAVAGMMLVMLGLFVVQVGIAVGYQAFFLGKFGATPGKMVFGLKVVRPDGARITGLRGAGRALAEFLSSLILCIGYIMAGFDDEKRSLHDRICDTRVVRT
jgi:uncharacterized RDD family membrane protein YckC